MSASLELFETLNARALSWTRLHVATSANGTVDKLRLYEHLTVEAAVIRCDVDGAADLTDVDVNGAVTNLVRFYGRFTRRHGVDNTALFNSVSEAARAWTQDRLARRSAGAVLEGKDRADLWDWLQARVAQACADLGLDPVAVRAEAVVKRVNRFCLAMRRASRKAAATSATSVTPRLNSRASRQADLAGLVEDALQGLMPGQKGPAVTVDEVHRAMPASTRVGPDGRRLRSYSRTAVARKLADLRGQPRREAAIAALRPTVRDLVWSLDHDLPASTVSVVTLAGLAGRLWPEQASKAGKCVHARRVRDALDEIPAGLGLHVEVVGDVVIVGRGRRIPVDRRDALLARAPRALPLGLIPSRMGMWGTAMGELVQAALQVVSGPAHEDDVDTVARGLGHPNGCPAMRALAAGGKTDPKWFPLASMRPPWRRGDPSWRHDVWRWAEYVVTGSESITADRWQAPDQEAALSILNLIAAAAESPQGPVEGTLAHLAATVPDLALASTGAPPCMLTDDGEAWHDFEGCRRLLAGATLQTWRALVMGTVIRPGRRPATAPALPQRPDPADAGAAARARADPVLAARHDGAQAPHAGGSNCHPRRQVQRLVHRGYDAAKGVLRRRARQGHRRRGLDGSPSGFLRTWKETAPRLHGLDQETGGAIRWVIKFAGVSLARGEPMSVPFATYCMERVTDAVSSASVMETLVADLLSKQRVFLPEPATA